jgi:general stress protein 26
MSQPDTLPPAEFDRIKHAIQDIRLALMTTQLPDGSLRSRPMLTHEIDPDGTMWFFTRDDSNKAAHIRQNPSIALGFSDPQKQTSVSTAGQAEIVHDQQKINELWKDTLLDWFPEGKDSPNLVLLRVTTQTGECWG